MSDPNKSVAAMKPSAITVVLIPAFKDNYIFALIDSELKSVVIIDPGDAQPVLAFLKQHALLLTGILITHHHWDHIGGITDLVAVHPAPVYGSAHEPIDAVTHPLYDNDIITLAHFSQSVQIMSIPGHTKGHIAYLVPGKIFCGDTLFAAGCGRLFEGTPDQLYQSLQHIQMLPDETEIYCAHEYTLNNLRFAAMVEPNNPAIKHRLAKVTELRNDHRPSIPSTVREEKATNPFLRCQSPEIIEHVAAHANVRLNSPIEIFTELRKWKDHF